MIETIRIVMTALAFVCIVAFSPALVHARDNTDRVYLLAVAAIVTGGGVGSFAHLHDPMPFGVLVAVGFAFLGYVGLLAASVMSRRRRRSRSAPPRTTGGRSG